MNQTLDIQWQPRNDIAIDIGYVGNLGRHEVIPVPFNQAQIASPANPAHKGTVFQQNYTYGYTVQQPGCSGSPNACAIFLPDGTQMQNNYEGGNSDLRVPYLGYSSEALSYTAAGVSGYNALQVHVEKRMSHGLQLGFFYNGNNPLDLRSGYGNSDFDRTHVINFTYLYQFPNAFSDSSWKGKITNGWAIEGVAVFQSGQPYSIVDYTG